MKELQRELNLAVEAVSSGPLPATASARSAAKWQDSRQDEERREIGIARLLSMFPAPADVDATLTTYIDQTRDIPWLFVSHAIKRLIDKPVNDRGSLVPRRFLPSISEIRYEAARVIRQFKLRAEGKDTREHSMRGDFELRPERWIEQAPEVMQAVQAQALLATSEAKRIS